MPGRTFLVPRALFVVASRCLPHHPGSPAYAYGVLPGLGQLGGSPLSIYLPAAGSSIQPLGLHT